MGVKIKCVCKVACNEGWMSNLETSVQSVLTPMIRDGAATALTVDDQQLLSTWACKTAMVFELTSTGQSFFTFADRDELRREQRPPSVSMNILLAHFSDGGPIMSTAHGRRVSLDAQIESEGQIHPDLVRIESNYLTVTLGRLVFQVVAFRSPSAVDTIRVPTMRNWSGHDTRIWPITNSLVQWPPILSLDVAALEEFARPFGHQRE